LFCHIISDFGDEDIRTLLDHFRTALDSADVVCGEIETEWTILKKEIRDG